MNLLSFDINEPNLKLMEKIDQIFPYITEKKAPLSISKISTRSYLHWKEMKLIDTDENSDEKRNWVKLNIYEFVWLEMINACRNFGLPIKDLQIMKTQLMDIPALEIAKDIEDFQNALKGHYTSGKPTYNEEEIRNQINSIMYISEIIEEIPIEDRIHLTVLGSQVNSLLLQNTYLKLRIFKEDDFLEILLLSDEQYDQYVELEPNQIIRPHITIDINDIIERFIGEPKNEKNLERWGFINKKERKVLDAIRNKDFSQIIIKRNNNSEDIQIEATLEDDILNEKAKQIRKILGLDEYSEVQIKYRNEKHLFIKSTKKI